MRILEVIPVFSPQFGGPVTVVRSISKELAKRHEVTVYTTSALNQRRDSGDSPFVDEFDGYRVVYFPRIFKFSGFNISPTMARALKETIDKYDVIHLHSWRQFQDVIVHHYAQKYGVPYVLQAHGSLPRIVVKRRLKWVYDVFFGYMLLRDASKIIALTEVEAQQHRNMGVPEDKIEVVPNGIDLSDYCDLPSKGSFKKKFGLDENEKIILYLGRIHRIKGIDILVKAFSNIVGKLDGFKLVIVGPDDGYLAELETLIKGMKMSGNVLILDPLYGRDKLEAYVDAEVFVLPSRYETFPMSALEAIACGTPIVLTKNCGGRSYFRESVGTVVEPDSNALSEVLLEMLLNKKQSSFFRENCRKIAKSNFPLEKVVDRMEQIYFKVKPAD
jgi:glycosyltransferase involved in cell wall biosynthesis